MKEEKVLKSDNEGGSSYCFANYKSQEVSRKVGKAKMKTYVRMKKIMNCPRVHPVANSFPSALHFLLAIFVTLIFLDDQMSQREFSEDYLKKLVWDFPIQ